MNLFKKVNKYFADKRHKITLPVDKVNEIIKKYNVSEWFIYAFNNRTERRHICEPSLWILNNISKESKIFETGCGCGFNLIWFAQNGYNRLLGSDISVEAVLAGNEIAQLANYAIELWQDDGINPNKHPEMVDVLLALNWTYTIESFELTTFLHNCSKSLKIGGYVVIEIIDTSFNDTLNNQYLTSDWTKPLDVRRPSEYKIRYSYEQVVNIAKMTGYELYHTIKINQIIPRFVYILRKS